MMESSFADVLDFLRPSTKQDYGYWASLGKIPLGTIEPIESYNGHIPDEQIVSIPFDTIYTSATQRKANNVLLLGASGDGKSLQMKGAWAVLSQAGYYNMYIDPKSADCGRAKVGWHNARMPPYSKAQGIGLVHYMPNFAIKNYELRHHNLKKYGNPFSLLTERDMWMNLSATNLAGIKMAKAVQEGANNKNSLRRELKEQMELGVLQSSTFANADSVLEDALYFNIIGGGKQIPLDKYWNKENKKDVAISYFRMEQRFIAFDVGMRIKQVHKFKRNNMEDVTPVVIFFDDASLYTDPRSNDCIFASNQIRDIGNIDRSLGIYNWLAVQSLNIIDESLAETYPIKIISPKFANPESLSRLGIPRYVINWIKNNELYINNKTHTYEWILQNQDKEYIRYFPFNPPCNHFTEIYEVAT